MERGNSGKVPGLGTLQSHSFRDTGSTPPKHVSRPANIKRCKLQAHNNPCIGISKTNFHSVLWYLFIFHQHSPMLEPA